MQILLVSEIGFIKCKPLREPFLYSFLKRTFSEQNILCHEEVQPACNIRTDMGVSKPADRMYNVDCITIRVHSAAFHNTAVKTCRHDPHQASVTVIPFLIAAAFLCFSIFLVSVDCLHCAAADIVGFSIRSKFSVVEPLHKVPHDIVEINLSDTPDAFQECNRQAAVICPGSFRKIECAISAHAGNRVPGNFIPGFKLYRASKSITDNNTHDPIQPDIGIVCHKNHLLH